MAKEAPLNTTATASAPAAAPAPEAQAKESFSLKKVLLIGIPIILVQVVLVYFLFVKFIAPNNAEQQSAEGEHSNESREDLAQVLVIKDIIVNPAGTNGTRFLLTTVGLEVPAPEIKAELEQKEVQTRDILNTILTSKGLEELTIPQYKESLRREILEKVNNTLKKGKVSNVYFSKFIIQ